MLRLRFPGRGLLTALALIAAGPALAQAPANDLCSAAQLIPTTGTSIPGTTLGATDNLIGLLGCQNVTQPDHPDVWYQFTATGTRLNYTVTATPGAPLEVLVFDGSCSAGLLVLTSDCGTGSITNGVGGLTVGQDYRIAIASPSAATTGPFALQIQTVTPPVTAAQDCNAAAILTSSATFTQGTSNQGSGALANEVSTTNSCWGSGRERQSKWFKFVAGATGKLLFNIQPNVPADDYDWAVWDITGDPTGCTTKGNAIACNWTGADGATGLSLCHTQEPGYLNPGSLTNPFANTTTGQTGANAPITVQAGRVYTLLVDNFTQSNNGFTLRFGGACGPPAGQVVTQIGIDAEFGFTKSGCNVVNFAKTRAFVAGTSATYFWNFGDGATSTLAAPSHTYAPGTISTYTVTLQVTDVLGNRATFSLPVLIAPPTVVAIAGGGGTTCPGQPVTLTASGAATYTWTPATGLNTTTGATVTASPNQTTTYIVTGTQDQCTSTDTVTVTVAPPPNARVLASGPTSLCAGQSVELRARGGTSYLWSPATGLSSTTDSVVTATPTQTTTYTVIVMGNGCTALATQTVTVGAPISLQLVSSVPGAICAGQSVGLRARGGVGTSYVWSPATGLSSTTDSVVTASPTQTTTYTVTATRGACTATQTITVTVTPGLNLAAVAAVPTLCAGQQTTLTATGGASYVWAPATGLSSTTDSVVTATPTQTTTYTVTATRGACTAIQTVTVTVTAPLNLQLAAVGTPAICAGASLGLAVTGGPAGGTATSYVWAPATGLSSTTDSVVTATPTQTTTYTVTATRGACTATQTITVTVTQALNLAAVAAVPTLCAGQQTTLTATGGASYVWAPATGLSSTTDSVVTATPTQTTTYTVTATRGACTATQTVTVTVTPLPTTQLTTTATALCAGATATLTATGADRYVWTPAPGLALADSANATVTVSPSATTTYTVTGYRAAGCPVTATLTVTVAAPQATSGTVTDSTGLPGHTAAFQATVTGATAWQWNFGDGQTSTEENPTHTYATAGTYSVTLRATYGTAGCQTTERRITTVVIGNPTAYNILTPNGDQLNDVFSAPVSSKTINLKVFSRWGREVLNQPNYQQDWNGGDLPAGTYYYMIDDADGKTWKGWLEIVR